MIRALKNRKGVTLVELLAVIVILAIIAAIAVPTIGGLISNQREKAAGLSYDAVIEAADYYILDVATLVEDDEFTLADVITNGNLDANPFDGAPAVTFTVGANGTFTITDPAELTIDDFVVFP
ncbi:MAG: prepilin-type N-terminal cleavage/methylation domain-containing protein [Firmicutes bacterium]|nr:prepilin-type N-terminal cleavage/methylation domain-containing protein [Bacillota bacterium]